MNENIEDFGLSSEEALKDAINQFNKQGVDLTGIDISGGIGREEALSSIKNLVSVVRDSSDFQLILEAISSAKKLCNKEETLYLRNIQLLMKNDGVNSLHLLLEPSKPTSILLSVFNFMEEISVASGATNLQTNI